MTNEICTILGQLAVVAAFGAVGAMLFERNFRFKWFMASLALFVLYDLLLTRGFYAIPNIPTDARWNWSGKALAAIGMLLIASLPTFGLKKAGLTLAQRNGFLTPLIVTAILGASFFILAISDGSGPADFETIAFQWTMPGIDEEMFYRGVLLLALNEAFKSRVDVLGAQIGYGGLLSSLLFGLVHALAYDDGGFAFNIETFAVTGLPSLILLWLRERTGSLFFPIVAHNFANGAFASI